MSALDLLRNWEKGVTVNRNPDFHLLIRSECRIYESLTCESNHFSSQRGDSAHPLQISVATEPFSRVQSCFLYERD